MFGGGGGGLGRAAMIGATIVPPGGIGFALSSVIAVSTLVAGESWGCATSVWICVGTSCRNSDSCRNSSSSISGRAKFTTSCESDELDP